MIKRLPIGIALLAALGLFACIACCLALRVSFPRISIAVDTGGGGGGPGGTGTCDSVGVVVEGNPIYGWPVPGTDWGNITAYYCDPAYYEMFGRDHWGIDISAVAGTEIIATLDGVVIRSALDTTYGMGNNIQIATQDGWTVTVMHLQDRFVEAGQSVSWGDVIGTIDSTGNSTGSHLHYEIHDPTGQRVDPAPTM